MKRLYVDIETSYNICSSWRIGGKVYLSPDNIIEEREIIMISYMWSTDKKPSNLSWDWDKKGQRDKKMLKDFSKVYAQADEVVAHNGAHFDLPWIRTRLMMHKLPPLPGVKMVDTYKLTKNGFYFNSNRLDYLSKAVGLKGKKEVGFKLWDDVILYNDSKALSTMSKYCNRDVTTLKSYDEVLDKYLPKPVSSRKVKEGSLNCVECIKKGKKKTLLKNGYLYTQAGRRQRYRCKVCNMCHFSTGVEYL